MSSWQKPETGKQKNMKTSQNLNRGSAKSSLRNQTFKNGESSSTKSEQISKYFIVNKPCKEDSSQSSNSDQLDSPYKKSLSEIKCVFDDDDFSKDFRTPKPIKVQKKSQHKRTVSLRQAKLKSTNILKCKSTTNKNTLFKATEDNFGLSDVNPDHLQMALALSKSTYAVEYPELSKNTDDDTFSNFLTLEKIPKGKTTLERYGFKTDKPKLHAEMRREYIEVPKKNKNSKFRFITPTLKTRTTEERESIIATKISLILCRIRNPNEELEEPQNVYELCSDMLKKFKGNNSIFAANAFGLEENGKYYKQNLNISPSRSKCGCLLKKWEDIAGREKSPVRGELKSVIILDSSNNTKKLNFEINELENNDVSNNIESNISPLSPKYPTNRDCISPDLFESESETEYTPKSPDIIDDFSQSLLSPSKKRPKLRSTQNDSFENKPKYTTCKTDNNLELGDNNSVDIIMNLTQINTSLTKKEDDASVIEYSEDEDTEELYINSLKSKEDFIVNLTQESSEKYKDAVKKLSIESEKSHLSPQKEVIVDLTLSSDDDDSSNHYSMEKIDNEFNVNENVDTEDCDTNFDMSPLYLKDSGNLLENESGTASTKKQSLCNLGDSIYSKTSVEISFALDEVDDCKRTLNVTDYITQILNEDQIGENIADCSSLNNGKFSTRTVENPNDSFENDLKGNYENDDNELVSSQESHSYESIVISDEELNYSSVHSKDAKLNYDLLDVETSESNECKRDSMDIDEIYSIHSVLKSKYGSNPVPTPVHSRISELRGNSPLPKASLTKACLEDSFNEILENSNILKELENETNEKLISNPCLIENVEKCTPEKVLVASPDNNASTPENNLIIKTKDVTPLVNYDEMDTPKITKELQKFGLKPLKRQRGIKLLKYLYESTHPLVGTGDVEELSSDEEDQNRVFKRRKKTSKSNESGITSVVTGQNILRYQGDIEIVGDALLKNENSEELIFERRFSVKISSCRMPLQIAWHNFLCQNTHIKENILLYEPLQLEVLYAMIKEQTGCKFHIQDLLTFFDKKCITIRTAQGSRGKQKT